MKIPKETVMEILKQNDYKKKERVLLLINKRWSRDKRGKWLGLTLTPEQLSISHTEPH